MPYGSINADLIVGTNGNKISPENTFGFRNRIINGQMQIAQRATSGTSGLGVPTTTATYPSVDRWFAYGTGATVTVAQVAGATNTKNLIQLTGAASVTGAGIGQRIESINSYDLAGQTVTLSANIANTLLTTVTWTAYYASSSDVWTSSTQIATGTWTVSSTIANYSAQIAIPAAATTGIQVIYSVGAQTSGTFQIGNAQLEVGTNATSFEYRPYGTELQLCQRYTQVFGGDSNFNSVGTVGVAATTTLIDYYSFPLAVKLRANPSLSYSGNWRVDDMYIAPSFVTNILINGNSVNQTTGVISIYVASGLTGGRVYQLQSNNNTTARLILNSEL